MRHVPLDCFATLALFGVARAARPEPFCPPSATSCRELMAIFGAGDNPRVAELDIGYGGKICGPASFVGVKDDKDVEVLSLKAGECIGGHD